MEVSGEGSSELFGRFSSSCAESLTYLKLVDLCPFPASIAGAFKSLKEVWLKGPGCKAAFDSMTVAVSKENPTFKVDITDTAEKSQLVEGRLTERKLELEGDGAARILLKLSRSCSAWLETVAVRDKSRDGFEAGSVGDSMFGSMHALQLEGAGAAAVFVNIASWCASRLVTVTLSDLRRPFPRGAPPLQGRFSSLEQLRLEGTHTYDFAMALLRSATASLKKLKLCDTQKFAEAIHCGPFTVRDERRGARTIDWGGCQRGDE
eukprot:GHVU01191154.1.p2 GENE.GHVU01191154.1~~GHVU01191154.1.p2  ORF type:complete len:263 (+),score=66.84 GHVU01191154.1:386-1174(+)